MGKSLSTISDEEEIILFDKLNDILFELDNLSEISKVNINENQDEIFKLEITSFVDGLKKNTTRISKEKKENIDSEIIKIESILGTNKKMNIAILTKLLQKLIIKND